MNSFRVSQARGAFSRVVHRLLTELLSESPPSVHGIHGVHGQGDDGASILVSPRIVSGASYVSIEVRGHLYGAKRRMDHLIASPSEEEDVDAWVGKATDMVVGDLYDESEDDEDQS